MPPRGTQTGLRGGPVQSGPHEVQQGQVLISSVMEKFFTWRVVRPWHRLPREAVDAPSLAAFKARLDGATWSCGRCPCPWQGTGTRWSVKCLPTQTIL